MRSLFLASLLLACARHGEVPTAERNPGDSDALPRSDASISTDRTHIDRPDLALDLPGRWDEHAIAVLGEAVVEGCRPALESSGLRRDDQAADLVGRKTGKRLACYGQPR
jgi:hypothetical protein